MARARAGGFAVLAVLPMLATAQRGAPPLAQWHHTSWTGDAGPPKAGGDVMRRSSDGYLWLSAENGLLRFDGVRFTFIDSMSAPEFRAGTDGSFFPRFTDKTGALWVEGPNGLVLSYLDGRFRVITPVGSGIRRIEQDGGGRVWALTTRLHILTNGALTPPPLPPGVPDSGITSFASDTGSGMWFGTETKGLWHVTGDTAEHYATGRAVTLRQTRDGTLWANVDDFGPTVYRLVSGSWYEVRGPGNEFIRLRDVVEGPDGSTWLPTNLLGVLRWRGDGVERFSRKDGLSFDNVTGLFVDTEGPVWVATIAGLDRLRPSTFVPIEFRDGLPDNVTPSFVLDISGAIWMRTRASDSVVRLDGGAIRREPGRVTAQAYRGPSNNTFQLITRGQQGGVWIGPSRGGLVRYTTHGTTVFDKRHGLPSAQIQAGVEARDGTLWVTAANGEVGRLRNGRYRKIPLPWGSVTGRSFVEDGFGRVWVASRSSDSLLALAGDSIVAEVTLPGRESVRFRTLTLEGGDTLWAAGTEALFRVIGTRAVEVRVPALKPLLADGVKIAVADGQLWVAGPGGVGRVKLSALHRAANAEPLLIEPKIFGPLDGVPGGRLPSSYLHPIHVANDGRVWIMTTTGLAVADPAFEDGNATVPRVHIEGLTIDGRTRALSDGGTIPPNPNRLALRFAAPMLGRPELGRVEYRLDGTDENWRDGGPLHVAEYSHLKPGRYRFRVRAWNEDRVPSAGEATLNFRVLPAWYQAWWFFALGAVAIASMGGGAVAAVQRRRSQRAVRDVQARFDAVLSERTRMARELHDTLLQGFTGITLQLESVRASLESRAEPSANRLGDILHLADRTLREARDMVWDIRQPGSEIEDLGESLCAAVRELTQPEGVALRSSVDGVPRQLAPIVVTTILRIANEAVVNAMKHAQPSSIVVQLVYEPHRVLLDVADDGIGSDPAAFDAAPALGHWGVAGMYERARAAGGTVVVTSDRGQGTRISVSLPAEPLS